MVNLRPCPFCAGRAQIYEEPDSSFNPFPFFVQCKECLAESQHCSKIEYAVEAWNRRTDDGRIETLSEMP